MSSSRLRSVALVCAAALPLAAQDTRTVVEPARPPACATLTAALATVSDTTIAEADERRLDTPRIQHAIDACARGRAVVLTASGAQRAFLAGPLVLRPGVTLVVDRGAVLFGSRDPREYDVEPGRCGTVDKKGRGCRPMIFGDGVARAAVMGPGTIDGRGWATLLGTGVSWWDLAQQAKVRNESQNCPRILVVTRSTDFTLYDVTLRNSGNFHVVFDHGNGFTAWGVVIDTPKGARNTDGIDPSSSTNVTITRSFIHTGDDNVAIKAGGPDVTQHVTISHNHFYTGHGMSIGSETNGGARAIRVFDLTIDGADNGIRIKSNASRGGRVEDVEYRDVCIRDTRNVVEMDSHYSAPPQTTGDLIPQYLDIRLHDVRVEGGQRVLLDGYDAAHPLGIAFDNVVFDAPGSLQVVARHADVRTGPGAFNLTVAGEGVRVKGLAGRSHPVDCAGRFVPMPRAGTPNHPGVPDRPAAIVDGTFTGTPGDSVGGIPVFRSVGQVLSAQTVNGGARTIIFVRNGRYREKLTVDRPRITLLGESRDGVVLTYDANADTPSPGGGTYGTRGSFTLRLVAPDFRAENLTIENAFDYDANTAKPDSDRTKVRNQQAVAVMTDLGSDRATFVNVKITGFQDTLFPNAGRSYFYHCEISGNVDFIFGAGQAVFDDCDIVSRDRHSASNNGYISAPSTKAADRHGFLFIRSRLKKERAGMAANSVTLGRPWHPFAATEVNGSALFIACWMDDHIGARGWDRMSSIDSTGARIWYEPTDARFAEYGTTGPGAVASARRRVLSASEAATYTPRAVLGGWSPPLTSTRTTSAHSPAAPSGRARERGRA